MMKRALQTVLAFVLPLAITITSALAKAPGTQYADFDKTSATIEDNFTKLEWERTSRPADATGQLYTNQTNLNACRVGFRLPTLKEFLSIVDEEPHWYQSPSSKIVLRAVDPNAFPNLPVDFPYWVSSGGASSTLVYLTSKTYLSPMAQATLGAEDVVPGESKNVTGTSDSGYVLCVRSARKQDAGPDAR
jgi:hypothetical protein